MKHRICLAWFGDLDVPLRDRPKPKKETTIIPVPAATRTPRHRVKDAAELRRMFGRD
ncbi:hypothetical protein OKA04_05175 [Luteolibacter flavescens]|uniref:Uncharacterized protein n=1 Tax=Luteolibacter flavescens TaxID=1859460 RepID=A0ABT3FKK2_9BACT|nr:hypothetical protein [Luteolibacter flavescens]MCW1884111.1 hypothetical protein [Luteolibacter flavescens]